MKKRVSILMAAGILSACGLLGTPPSENEIKEIFTKDFEKINKRARMLGSSGERMIMYIKSLTNHGCESHVSMEGAYTCDVEITGGSEMLGISTTRTMLSFAKTKEGVWYGIK